MTPVEILLVGVAGLLVIAGCQAVAPRVRLAAPLLLVLVGVVVGEVPAVPSVEVEPEWILAGVLPPLLYSSAVSMPAMDFRRELGAIGSLSVLLVLVTTGVCGLFFWWAIPDLPLAWAIALGAIVSPTDAVATAIVKPLGVSDRVVTMLDGESLLNDATALVLLRSAIAAAAGAATVTGVVGDFAFAVVVAVVLGLVAGRVNLWLRARTPDPTVNTVVSFAVPFAASIPAEALGASGLVAAVVAGLVTGRRAPRVLPPRHRLSDEVNWRTLELVLEGGVFLLLGLQLAGILEDVAAGTGTALAAAAGALALTVVVRALYVGPLVGRLGRRAARSARMQPQLAATNERLAARETITREEIGAELARLQRRQHPEGRQPRPRRGGPPRLSERQVDRFRTRLRRLQADVEYLLARPLGRREGAIVVWAGMRGAVTLAAAQTLPEDAPSRSLLILVAFAVAVGSLVVQGATLPWLAGRIGATAADEPEPDREGLFALLAEAEASVPGEDRSSKPHRLAVLDAQRTALLDARDDGRFPSAMLAAVLDVLDADQIGLELKGGPA